MPTPRLRRDDVDPVVEEIPVLTESAAPIRHSCLAWAFAALDDLAPEDYTRDRVREKLIEATR